MDTDASSALDNKSEIAAIRILLVDDHEVARRALRAVINLNPSLEVVAEAADGEEAIQKVKELHPDIVLLDVSLPGISGIQAVPQIRANSPESRIIFVSQHIAVALAKDALRGGAYGYVVKSDAGLDLLSAIEAAHEGRRFVSRTLHTSGWA